MAKVNLRDKLSKFSEQWTPKVVAEINDYHCLLYTSPSPRDS